MAAERDGRANGRGRLPRRIRIGALAMAVVGALAFASVAFAHHVTFTAIATCETWTATSTYVAGPNATLRLVILENIVVNGMPYDPSWSTGFPGAGFVDGTAAPISDVVVPGVPAGRHFYWQGVVESAIIFNRHQANSGAFDTAGGAWTGTISIYKRNSANTGWDLQPGVNAEVDQPAAAEGCGGGTKLREAASTPTAVATKTAVAAGAPQPPASGSGQGSERHEDNLFLIVIGTLAAASVTLAVVLAKRDS